MKLFFLILISSFCLGKNSNAQTDSLRIFDPMVSVISGSQPMIDSLNFDITPSSDSVKMQVVFKVNKIQDLKYVFIKLGPTKFDNAVLNKSLTKGDNNGSLFIRDEANKEFVISGRVVYYEFVLHKNALSNLKWLNISGQDIFGNNSAAAFAEIF